MGHSDRVQTNLRSAYPLPKRLWENQQRLTFIHKKFSESQAADKTILPPSAEWLVENFYLIQDQIRQSKADLSSGFYKRLPKLVAGPHKDDPRIYGIAMEIIAHTDSHLDRDTLLTFLNEYQRVAALNSAELWAFPIMLRLSLIENLRRLMDQAQITMLKRHSAKELSDRIISEQNNNGKQRAVKVLSKYFPPDKQMDPAFTIYIVQRLREADPVALNLINWVEERVSEHDINLEEFIRVETHQRTLNRSSVGNVVNSLRMLSFMNWSSFFEDTSPVDKILRLDPSGVYTKMDFSTRDRYRHVVETLSKFSIYSEQEIARRALRLAGMWSDEHPAERDRRQAHIGYYIISGGLEKLRQRVNYEPYPLQRIVDWIKAHPFNAYIGIVGIVFASALFGTLLISDIIFPTFSHQLAALLLLAFPLSSPSISLVNWVFTSLLPPSPPPKIALDEHIPDSAKTIIAIPCLISDTLGIKKLLEHLEKRYLSNKETNLYFALLSDFSDAPEESMPDDERLMKNITAGIKKLNKTHAQPGEDIFYLFHRKRVYNEREGVWLGWERKRGKVIEFNRFLTGSSETTYSISTGNPDLPGRIKYVISLDADTELPMNTARKLIGTMLHPLNKPVIDPDRKIVIDGYGIIQPRVDTSAPSAARSLFSQIFTRESGLDPYSSAISNIYQDLLGDGIFIGKAIYDVEAFKEIVQERFPENTLLSHDLLEGEYARTGLTTDVELLEDFPSGYNIFVHRMHRWVRGDWQTADWVSPIVPDAKGNGAVNPLPYSSRWKFFDNLRRSLVQPGIVALLIAGWTLLPGDPLFWTTVASLSLLFSLIEGFLNAIAFHPPGESRAGYLWVVGRETKQTILHALLLITLLPHQAYMNVHAIVQVFYRRIFSKKGLLEWTTHAETEQGRSMSITDYVYFMWISILLPIVLVGLLLVYKPLSLYSALPLTTLWLLAPAVAYVISQPIRLRPEPASEEADVELHKISARIWRFFEDYVQSEDNYLPPDNFQEVPKEVIAHRTSPTNIGLYLLSLISAYDLGLIGSEEFTGRLENTIRTLSKLPKHQGHLFNWYHTQTLEPFSMYVSTVDSGNLAATLLTVKEACADIPTDTRYRQKIVKGLLVILNILEELEVPEELSENVALFNDTIVNLSKQVLITDESVNIIKEAFAKLNVLKSEPDGEIAHWVNKANRLIVELENKPENFRNTLKVLGKRCQTMAESMDFTFLIEKNRGIFSIGYNLNLHKQDDSYYDLLATEARIASYFAISQRQIDPRHWFKLSRPLTRISNKLTLLSWGGSMFEYLMPSLLIKDYENTLLYQSIEASVEKQIDRARKRELPWGVSESGFFAFDFQFNYQYKLFGISELGLKSDLGGESVVAPYATFLALSIKPKEAWKNLSILRDMGMTGKYGFYEAIDFTPYRLSKGKGFGIVQSYMAHHQGMSLAAINNYINNDILRERFHRDPAIASAELILQEKIPRHAPALETPDRKLFFRRKTDIKEEPVIYRMFNTPNTSVPHTQVLSNGQYTVVFSNAGGNYSKYNDISVTRYRADPTLDNQGMFFYIKDMNSGQFWSSTYQPVLRQPADYTVYFYPHKVETSRKDDGIETKTETFVSPERNVEIRKITLTNLSKVPKRLEVTSYAEVALNGHRADASHPAFSKMFVESDYEEHSKVLLFRRRPRSADEDSNYVFHMLTSANPDIKPDEFETDRLKFLGRGGTVLNPQALSKPLSDTVGHTLDPVMSIRSYIILEPDSSENLYFVTGIAPSREEALVIASEYDTEREINRTADLARIYSQIQLQHLGVSPEEDALFQKLGSRVLFPETPLMARNTITVQNKLGQSGLFPLGISGDLPIVLVKVRKKEGLDLVKQLLLAHEYFRMRNFMFDLVILSDEPVTYTDQMYQTVQYLIETSLSRPWTDVPGGIFLRRSEQVTPEERTLLHTTAKVVLDSDLGSLTEHMQYTARPDETTSLQIRDRREVETQGRLKDPSTLPVQEELRSLEYGTALGGFDAANKEFVINLNEDTVTPMPWSNVISNTDFGTVVTESGLGYSWNFNSQLNKLTPWSNDPVSDDSGEIIYLRDEESGELWTPTPQPLRDKEPYIIRHGRGYTVYEHTSRGIIQTLKVYIPEKHPVKIMKLRLHNTSSYKRTVSATLFTEWVLGTSSGETGPYIVTKFLRDEGILFARNIYTEDFKEQRAFIGSTARILWASGDRKEFLGRNGSKKFPKALAEGTASQLIGYFGSRLDPCGVIQTKLDLESGEEKEIVFFLGQTASEEDAVNLIKYYTGSGEEDTTKDFWTETLDRIQISTPDRSFDLLVNDWLLYQVFSCRYRARGAFYQAGGAYGFRDQLQDVMALALTNPDITKEHIIRAAGHQFREGDVQHWWHPPTNKGVRTRISDDLLWLPYAAEYYIRVTGDKNILDEMAPFLQMPVLKPEEHELYGEPELSEELGSLYVHCIKAIDYSLKFGEHGLPLMGTGDWNDGMNKVGEEGKGESVWLGWFLYSVLSSFIPICKDKGDREKAGEYKQTAEKLKEVLNTAGWDGRWFKRAYFDNGKAIGTKDNDECIIDSISQSWSVISGAGDPEKQKSALRAAEELLVKDEEKLLLLLAPPFDKSEPTPGYIQGYPPGIRENGGQYTHGVVWMVLANAMKGNGGRAFELFQMLNPIQHSLNQQAIEKYKTEPYIMAADVYNNPQHIGRGGWSWYTGSAGWMYRTAIENILGLKVDGSFFSLEPNIPGDWNEYKITYRYGKSVYNIQVLNPLKNGSKVSDLVLDGTKTVDKKVPLKDDGSTHEVVVILG
ncbi:hypothetical protein A2976_01815 [candidate division WWE3 bacterium RIFCSPLOWO2_01_FULL_41_9]|uniref:Carbohydrate binding domain-containing protein n=1 Tax=candidate division WWE3 bacterium RIFCSPLOWO2_01_FULL_41_9 TaxID=1802626 RepID=A0A1F4VIZ7_UNCKA|nr:MAG: hypothetical protein A2976_01815 [candidate division WWE3 bacterium RIFCSPLOWO2_01_FULL_41_9]